MVTPPVEPDSPVLYYDDEPQLAGVRNLSVSSDGTIDSLVSLDENPTPPQSPSQHPVVHVSPPGATYSLDDDSGAVDFDQLDSRAFFHDRSKTPSAASSDLATNIALPHSPFFTMERPSTPLALKLDGLLPTPTETPTLAARRAASGKLPNKALLSLQQMRFEASRDAGMGLGVGPGSAGFEGMEGVSPGGPGYTFRLNMEFDGDKAGRRSRPSSPLPSPGIENVAVGDSPTLRRSPSSKLGMPRSPGGSPALSSVSAFKPSLRNDNLRLDVPSRSSSPSLDRAPSSPLTRSSAFHFTNTGPRTPLTPSHLPGAPSLGAGGPAFSWFSYSMPDSPGCPVPPPGIPVAERTCYFTDLAPASPSAHSSYLPTPGSDRTLRRSPMPASPLGQGAFASSSNPFFS
ncbi:hypothetical protein NBRC10512_004959 [Rhodotorula toruloides]|uniref:RHTO0S01e13718g1_1 n=2 Tax=Rhodotorula toruloides TaxID=5286 RepID=A0A061AL76_RHOTO|nr:uncharacterized protein RHTO_04653 [Rhodotorula toruloides NP11]EMS24474.1 hypothetical protein RHTO_04653 [Rhodotorula toruloides NP11]CDR36075.1 RHTO0S01e13718g1_1 [Rhodotorula toruloides]